MAVGEQAGGRVGWTVLLGAVWGLGSMLLGVAAVAAVAAVAPLVVDRPAEVSEHPVRGEPFQATDTLPPPPGCRRVIVIGDSLTDNARPWLLTGLRDGGFEAHVDAQPSRRIPAAVRAPYSGVKAAASARSAFGEADCWVVALGSNDLIFGGDEPPAAAGMIDEMLSAVTPGAAVWWVNLNYHQDPRTSFGFVSATRIFNAALSERAADDPDLEVIDWYGLSEANLSWFFDPVHVGRYGSIVRADQIVDALGRAS